MNPWTDPFLALAPAVSTPLERKPAGFWLRGVALIIDILVLAIPLLSCEALVRITNPSVSEQDVIFTAELLKLVIWAVYFSLMHSIWGATLGKRAVRIRVIDSDGRVPSLARSILRFGGFVLSGLLLLGGFIVAAFTQRKRALHDFIAGTEVVQETPTALAGEPLAGSETPNPT